ncbi:MAG TPA: O-antigen ligase family protein [Candidatus Saccharimonadales bacterium]|nr:O-antigen ligase family protein [Candidatus Saccharimonadales bacterium]
MYEALFLLVLATIPIQLGKFFFLDHSYVLGIPIDYRALGIYASDIAVVMFLLTSLWHDRKKLKTIFAKYKAYIISLLIFNLYLWISAFLFSTSKEASYIANSKLLFFGALSIFSADILKNKKIEKKAAFVLTISILWESLLLIAEFARQSSLNLQILGERAFDSSTVLIAHSQLLGRQLLRPYGTFPHPNVGAAFLVFGLILLVPSLSLRSGNSRRSNLLPISIVSVTAFALVVTFSKSAFVVLALCLLALIKKFQQLILFVAVVTVSTAALVVQTLNFQIASVAERLLLVQASLDIALKNPLFGVGTNNFILELSKLNLFSLSQTRLLQPVHNIFLLILAENGIVGLLLFTLVLFQIARYIDTKTKTVLFLAILVYASTDHFLWTLQQGQLMFWLLVGYFLSDLKRK